MANVEPQTIEEIMSSINTLVSNDDDPPEDGDEEWRTRLNLIWLAIRNWGTSKDVFFDELWKTYDSGATTLSGVDSYVLADLLDYRFAGGYLRLTLNGETSRVKIIETHQADKYVEAGEKAAYITGNQNDGVTLNLTWTPAAGDGTFGATFALDYYKYPFKPELAADKVEMSDPNYIVYWVAGQKSLLESQKNKFVTYDDMATDCMDNMVIMNDLTPDQHGDLVENADALHGAVLGE